MTRYCVVITFAFDDENDNRAETRARELADWMPDNLASAYGSDSNMKIIDVTVAGSRAVKC
jgi:hypothetical protein